MQVVYREGELLLVVGDLWAQAPQKVPRSVVLKQQGLSSLQANIDR